MAVADAPASGEGPAPFEQRARSFGAIAEHYARFRPAPPAAAVDWVLEGRPDRAVDLGAGTGALTELLVARAGEVIAVEPDVEMRAVLARRRLGALIVAAVGEALPLAGSRFDAVVASSSWHWMHPDTTPVEVGRVLRPGGVLGLLWNHADRSVGWVRDLLGPGLRDVGHETHSRDRERGRLSEGSPFRDPESRTIEWARAFDAEELVGLVGSYSRVITLPPDEKVRLLETARRAATELVADSPTSTIELPMRCLCWRFVRA